MARLAVDIQFDAPEIPEVLPEIVHDVAQEALPEIVQDVAQEVLPEIFQEILPQEIHNKLIFMIANDFKDWKAYLKLNSISLN